MELRLSVQMAYVSLICRIAFAVLGLLAATFPTTARAQTNNFSQYCAQFADGLCFDSLAAAETYLRTARVSDHPETAHFKATFTHALADGRIVLSYRVPDQPPEIMGAVEYSSGSSTYSTGVGILGPCNPVPYPSSGYCDSEQSVIDRMIAGTTKYDTANCFHSNFRIQGEYASPYASVGSGRSGSRLAGINYGERLLVDDYNCNGNISTNQQPMYKQQSYLCPLYFRGPIGLSASDILSRWPSKTYCRVDPATPGIAYASITKGLEQTESCRANENPCHPATGDKSRHEVDFTFGGREFARNYHSLRHLPSALMPLGWRHSYEERIVSNDYITYLYTDENGAGELFTFPTTSSASAASSKTTKHRLYRDPNNSTLGTTLRSIDGEVRTFDRYGYLTSIANPTSPERNISIVYEQPGDLNDGRILLARDFQGRELIFDYMGGRLTNIGLPDGGVVSYSVDTQDNLVAATVNGSVRSYFYDNSPGQLTRITAEDGLHFATFGYDSKGRVVSSALTVGGMDVEKTTLSYPTSTSVEVTTDGKGVRNFIVAAGLYRNVLSVTDSSGTATNQYVANSGIRNWQTDARGTQTYFDYWAGQLLERKRAVGSTVEARTSFEYDATGRPSRTIGYKKVGTTFVIQSINSVSYATTGSLSASCHIDGGVTGASGYVCGSQQNAPAGVRQIRFQYCAGSDVQAGLCPIEGLLTSIDGPRTDVNDVTTYTYFASDDATCSNTPTSCGHRKGDLWKVTNSLGQVTETLSYDGAGRVLSSKDLNGVVSDMQYDLRGRLTARKVRGANASVETDDAITRIEYWPTGLVKKVIQPHGAFTQYTYDTAHRLTDITDNAGNTIHYTLDNAGNRTQEDTKDPGNVLKRTLSRVYNQLGQLQTQADAQAHPTGFTYDANGNTNTVTDALGRIADNDYDPLNRLSRTLQNMGGINSETKFAYDAQDNLTQATDPKGLNTAYTYNGLGDLTQLASPDTGITDYTYDSAGNRASQTDARGKLSIYSYDALNRLTGIVYPNISYNIVYTYDSNQSVCATGETFSQGRLTKLADASGTTQYCFDRFGNLVRKVQTTNAKVFTVRYAYTLAGQLSSVTYPDGAIASYVRDAQGRTTQVNVQRAGAASEVLLNQASYHPFGPVAGWTYGNGRQLLRPLNQNYQPTAVEDASAGGLSVGFAYDPVGNLTQLTPAASSTPLVKFDYDALSRLTTFKDGPTDVAIESYTYDATGNRQSFTNSAGTQAYTYPSTNHRLSSVGSVARSYDAAGNTSGIGGTAKQFIYDDTGRMGQVKQAGVAVMNYRYNGKGEQVRKYLSTANTYTVYDEAGHWLGDYDSTGAALQQAIWLDDLPVGLIANGNQLHYVEPDHLGTPRVVIEVARNVPVWTWDLKSEAFGNSVPNQDPDGDANVFVFSMRFPGQRFDAFTGVNYNYFRDYEPGTGRYVQSDPIGQRGGYATFAYSNSSPLLTWDFFGLMPSLNPGPVNAEGVIGWVSCTKGTLSPVVVTSEAQRLYGQCAGPIEECARLHEESHIRDAQRLNPSICKERFWEPNYWRTQHLANTTQQGFKATEFGAHAVQLRCLAAKLRQTGDCDEKCRRTILRAIRDVADNIQLIASGHYGIPE